MASGAGRLAQAWKYSGSFPGFHLMLHSVFATINPDDVQGFLKKLRTRLAPEV